VASLSQVRTAAAQCGLFTYKSVLVIFEPPCIYYSKDGIWFEVLLFFVMTSYCCLASQDSQNIVLTCMVVGPFRHSETAEMWVRS